MSSAINRNHFFVKEHVGMFKAANNYDILDPETKSVIMECREENLGIFTRLLRFTDYKRMTPFDVTIRTTDGHQVVRVTRGISFFVSDVSVFDENNNLIGGFKQKFLSIGGKFSVLDKNDRPVCVLQGKWTSWDFRFVDGNTEYASVSKKWAGLGRELFTSADNYMLQINNNVPDDSDIRKLILAAVMCIDMVLKE
ncbi:MAG TPA: phospholipid scramblase-related protein [bacterium]|nr:phospholipid scramblase-related protein [bacterium]HPS29217.1 phospholipid scramblase-related protein [bacterium]